MRLAPHAAFLVESYPAPLCVLECKGAACASFSHNAPLLYRRRKFTLLQSDENDDNLPKKQYAPRRRRRRMATTEYSDNYKQQSIDDDNDGTVASSLVFLLQQVPIPMAGNLPLVYPLSISLAITIIPLVTWVLFVILFGVYLSLGVALLGTDSDNDIKRYNQSEYPDAGDDEDESDRRILPLAAFAAAVASAALISPQGLVVTGSESLPMILSSTLALFAVGLGGATIFMGIKELSDGEQHWEEREREESAARDEMKWMELWDDELEEKSPKKSED